MAELLVSEDSLDKLCVLQLASHFDFHLDELQVHMLPLHVSDSEDGIHCILCHLSVAPIDTFGPSVVTRVSMSGYVGIAGNGFCNFVQLLDDNVNEQQ